MLTWIIAIVITVGILVLIGWLRASIGRRSQAKLPELRRQALAAIAPMIQGQMEGERITGTWEGLPAEAANEAQPDSRCWRITLALPSSGADWRLLSVYLLGYMLQTGDRIGVEAPIVESTRKLLGGSATKEDINRSTALSMAFRTDYAAELKQGKDLVAGLGSLGNALTADLDNPTSFGLGGVVSYGAASGRLTYETTVSSEADIPNPQQFTAQLQMLSALRKPAI